MTDSPMVALLRKGLSIAGVACSGDLQFYRWVNTSPEGEVHIIDLDHLRKVIADPEGEYFFIDMTDVNVVGLTPFPIEIDKIGFQLGYNASTGEWAVKAFPDIVNLPSELYERESGEANYEKMEERMRLLANKIGSIVALITMAADSTRTT